MAPYNPDSSPPPEPYHSFSHLEQRPTRPESTSSLPRPSSDPSSPSTTYATNGPPPLFSTVYINTNVGSTGKGILIGMLSAFGSALLVILILALVYFLRYTNRGRILLDQLGRPGEYDDEQAFAKDEAEALEEMDDIQRAEYMRAKSFVQANPPESAQTDISLSQFLAIQEKGVSAWEFEPELEIANCFVEGRTEVEFYDTECSVQSNLPVPKQNEVYYWEAKIYDKPESTTIGIGMTTKPYPLFRMPGYHRTSVSYTSPGHRRFNQPFRPTPTYGPPYVRGDVVGCGYRPRTGTVFFTRNGKKLDDVTHSLKTQNLFPTVGANGPCSVHVNFGQMGFVFIEANVKKWGLAPMTGSLAPPPPYGSEAGSILLEGGKHGVPEGQGYFSASGGVTVGSHGSSRIHGRSRSATVRLSRQQAMSPGPERSPTDISLNQLSAVDSEESDLMDEDPGEGTSTGNAATVSTEVPTQATNMGRGNEGVGYVELPSDPPPPDYESPHTEEDEQREALLSRDHVGFLPDNASTPRAGSTTRTGDSVESEDSTVRSVNDRSTSSDVNQPDSPSPPIPSYDVAVGRAEDGMILPQFPPRSSSRR